MVDTHLARQIGANPAITSPATPEGVPTNILNQLTRWIPTETIAIYVALLALLAPVTQGSDYTSRWILFGIVVGANPIIVISIALAKSKISSESHGLPRWPGFHPPLFAIVVSMVAFAAWAFALPDTPLGNLSGYDTKWGVGIITVATIGITLLANALHKSPDLDQVQTVSQGAK
jgi:hypothetical protein